jgi:hypothetical protein
VLDGKEPKHGGGHSVLTAVSCPASNTCSPSKTTSPPCGQTSKNSFPPRRRIPLPRHQSASLGGAREFNKGELEVRVLRAGAASAEAVDFSCVEQVALLRRHLRKHYPETGALVNSLRAQELDAAQWLRDNRAA